MARQRTTKGGEARSAGGAAAAGGFEFQHRVAAWVAVRILAEKDSSPPWELPPTTSLEWLKCETHDPVDDLVVGTSAGGLVFIQAKDGITLSSAADSALASALDQFVRQYRAGAQHTEPSRTRPLDERDRLILVTSPTSSGPVRNAIPAVLRRTRNLRPDERLENAVRNEEERRALALVRKHLDSAWSKAAGSAPSDAALRKLLSLVHITVLEVRGGGAGEREAQDFLRTSVLHDQAGAPAAWALLIERCQALAAERSGANRAGLHAVLLSAGVRVKALPSFREEIERLERYSSRTSRALAHLARISINETSIKIERPVTDALRAAVGQGSLIVVGEPGAGKSGVIHDLVESLRAGGADCVFLAVDRIEARSLELLREELGLDHNLDEVLENWPGDAPAFLVVDGLDAARGDAASAMIEELIRGLRERPGRWRVVASIRKFDLRYGVALQELFVGEPPTALSDPEFGSVRHVNVPLLADEEIGQIEPQSAVLHAVVREAPPALRYLLRTLFNLRLVADLISAGLDPNELTPVRTDFELLDRYWAARVVRTDPHGDDREAVLRLACRRMLEQRALRVDRSVVAEAGTGRLLRDLLSTQVLVEWQASPEARPERYVLAFAHNVLFDDAVARLLLRGAGTVDLLRRDPDLVVAIRPSIVRHFHHVWAAGGDRREFWDLVLGIVRADEIPEVGKLIGPAVAASVARALSDLEPLCALLETAADREAAERSLNHLIGALVAAPDEGASVVGPGAGPWCALLERVSRTLRAGVAYSIRPLLMIACERAEQMTPEERAAAGTTARRLLAFAWARTPRDGWLVAHGLRAVCRTFEAEPAASRALVRRFLEPGRLAAHGYEEMRWLAQEVSRLVGVAPGLVRELYTVAFAHDESSDEPTPFGSSRILSMVSDRRQDYRGALYQLSEHYPEFLARAPHEAIRALLAVMESYVARDHRVEGSGEGDEMFECRGVARLHRDYSGVWDEGDVYEHDDPVRILNAFQHYLEGAAERPDAVEACRGVVELLVAENRLAVVWRRVLGVATRFPGTLGRELVPFSWALPILMSPDTSFVAGEFLRAIFPLLATSDRAKIEQAILSIPAGEGRVRDRLLGCLPEHELATDEAKALRTRLEARDEVPPNTPPTAFEWTAEEFGEAECLRELGVPVDAEPNRAMRERERPVKEFADRYVNSKPTLDDVVAVLPSLEALYRALMSADVDGVDPRQTSHAADCLAAACARIAKMEEVVCSEDAGSFVRSSLLAIADHPEPAHDPTEDERFDTRVSWGSPAPRIEAARGLIRLARNPSCVSPDLLGAIERLSEDPVPAVRFQIAHHLNAMFFTAPDVLWRVAERMADDEHSRGVLQGLLGGPLNRLAHADPERVVGLAERIFRRVSTGPGAETVRGLCIGLFAGLFIWKDQARCASLVAEIVTNAATRTDDASCVLKQLREPLTREGSDDAIRHRALGVMAQLLNVATHAFADLERRHAGAEPPPPVERERARSVAGLISHIGKEVYFSSGAYAAKSGACQVTGQARRFYSDAGAALDRLADVGLASIAHHLLETLNYFIPVDPPGVFLRVRRAVQAATKDAYQFEQLGADLVVHIVERYLAEQRFLLREDAECRQALVDLLDIFVRAGWPSARRLTYRLEEIYR